MLQRRLGFDFAPAGSVVIAAHKWHSNFGTLGAGYPRCNMRTCHEEQRTTLQGGMMFDAELAVPLEM